jgi:HEAT repeat protein
MAQPLLAILKDPDPMLRRTAINTLGRSWDMPLLQDLANEDPGKRREAAQKLAEKHDGRVLEPLHVPYHKRGLG